MRPVANYDESVGAQSSDIKVKRVYWGAIIAGAIVMLVAMMLLNLLGLGFGLGSINPETEAQPFQGLGTGALIWWIISNIIAIFAGAYVAGRMAGIPHQQSGVLHGIVSWCLYTIISIWIFTTAVGSVISGVGSIVSGTVSGLNKAVSNVNIGQSDILQNVNMQGVQPEVNQALKQLGMKDTLQQVRQDVQLSASQITAIAGNVFIKDGEFNNNPSRQEIEMAVIQETNLSQQQVEEVTDVLQRQSEKVRQEWQQLKQEAEETGQEIASASSSAAIWTFVALLIGAIVAAIAGGVGKPNHFLHEEIIIIER